MTKIFFTILGLVLILLLISCERVEPEINETTSIFNDKELEEMLLNDTLSGPCTTNWRCIGSNIKAYQLDNCSFTPERVECPLGCFEDECKKGETCETGFKCKNEFTKGFQTEVCTWTNTKKCNWRCIDGDCREKSENYTEEIVEKMVEEIAEPVVVKTKANELNLNEGLVIEVNGEEHNLFLFMLESEQAQVSLDGQRSDWLAEEESFTYKNGLTITIKEIFFQSFQGGKMAVSYTIG